MLRQGHVTQARSIAPAGLDVVAGVVDEHPIEHDRLDLMLLVGQLGVEPDDLIFMAEEVEVPRDLICLHPAHHFDQSRVQIVAWFAYNSSSSPTSYFTRI